MFDDKLEITISPNNLLKLCGQVITESLDQECEYLTSDAKSEIKETALDFLRLSIRDEFLQTNYMTEDTNV